MVTPKIILNAHTFYLWQNIKTRDIILKTEPTTIVYAQWDRWASNDMIKHQTITTDDTSKDNEESTLLRTGLSGAIIRLSIIFKLKPSLSLEKRFTSLWKKGENWQQYASSDPKTPCMSELLSVLQRFFYLDQGK